MNITNSIYDCCFKEILYLNKRKGYGMEKEILQNFNLYERIVIRVHKKLFIKHFNIKRIDLMNIIL